MTDDIIVVMPAHDEAATVGSLVREIRALGLPVIVVDDASTDRTAEEAQAAGARVLRLADNLGAWGAAQCGMRLALRLGYRRVVTFDADGQHQVQSIPQLSREHLGSGADVVIGACISRGSRLRHVAWRLFQALTGLKVQDLTSGLRIYGPRSLELLVTPEGSLIDYQDIGVLLLLHEAGCTVVERQVCMAERCNGKSRVFRSWFVVAEYMLFTFILSVCGNRRLGWRRRP